jgi:hypothetical protein
MFQAYAGEMDGHHEAGRGDGSDKMVRAMRATCLPLCLQPFAPSLPDTAMPLFLRRPTRARWTGTTVTAAAAAAATTRWYVLRVYASTCAPNIKRLASLTSLMQAYAGEMDGHHEAARGGGNDKMVRAVRATCLPLCLQHFAASLSHTAMSLFLCRPTRVR